MNFAGLQLLWAIVSICFAILARSDYDPTGEAVIWAECVSYAIYDDVFGSLQVIDHVLILNWVSHQCWHLNRATRTTELRNVDLGISNRKWLQENFLGPPRIIINLVGELILWFVERAVLSVGRQRRRQVCDVLREVIMAVAVLAAELPREYRRHFHTTY